MTPDNFTIDVYSEDGQHRAFGRARSIAHAVSQFQRARICRHPTERLLARIQRGDFGLWVFTIPSDDAPEDWVDAAIARCERVRDGRRERVPRVLIWDGTDFVAQSPTGLPEYR